MTDDMTTRPTIETVLERIGAFDRKVDDAITALAHKIDTLERKVDDRIDGLEKKVDERFDQANARFRHLDNEIDSLSSVAHHTKAEMHTLRLAFREMQAHLKEALPVLQES